MPALLLPVRNGKESARVSSEQIINQPKKEGQTGTLGSFKMSPWIGQVPGQMALWHLSNEINMPSVTNPAGLAC